MAVDERCESWDLPVSMCGCPVHRGGMTPQEEAKFERRFYENQVRIPSGWFTAQYPGVCVAGDHEFDAGTTVRYDGGNHGDLECRECVT